MLRIIFSCLWFALDCILWIWLWFFNFLTEVTWKVLCQKENLFFKCFFFFKNSEIKGGDIKGGHDKIVHPCHYHLIKGVLNDSFSYVLVFVYFGFHILCCPGSMYCVPVFGFLSCFWKFVLPPFNYVVLLSQCKSFNYRKFSIVNLLAHSQLQTLFVYIDCKHTVLVMFSLSNCIKLAVDWSMFTAAWKIQQTLYNSHILSYHLNIIFLLWVYQRWHAKCTRSVVSQFFEVKFFLVSKENGAF